MSAGFVGLLDRRSGAGAAALLLIIGCAGCDSGSGEDGAVPKVTVTFELGSDGASISGQAAEAGKTPVTFTALKLGAQAASASFKLGEKELGVTLSGPDSGLLTWNGVSMDGNGALSQEEQAALEDLQASGLASTMAALPLELGCQAATLDLAAAAALLVPWQMTLKYLTQERALAVAPWAAASSCDYLSAPGVDEGRPSPSIVLVDRSSMIPYVVGYLPLDNQGAASKVTISEASSPRLLQTEPAGSKIGPCNSLCRGACGPDCAWTNCREPVSETWYCETEKDTGKLTGYKKLWNTLSCGVHQGCVWHDACFDDCNTLWGCDSWFAFFCMHNPLNGCDVKACAAQALDTGAPDCALWASGFGPFQKREEFTYPDETKAAVKDPYECPRLTDSSHLVWQNPAPYEVMKWQEAFDYCAGLAWQGAVWRLPTISELRTLIRGSTETETGGTCGVTDSCLSSSCYNASQCDSSCPGCSPPKKDCFMATDMFGPCDPGNCVFWSASAIEDHPDYAWYIAFDYGALVGIQKYQTYHVRCVTGNQ